MLSYILAALMIFCYAKTSSADADVDAGLQALAAASKNLSPNLQTACAGVDLNANSQLSLICKAANANVDGFITNDNNARVGASIAVVCGFGCASGDGICVGPDVKGSGGDPCKSAVKVGTAAFNSNKAGQADVKAGNENLDKAKILLGNTAGVVGGSGLSANSTTIDNTLFPACEKASTTQTVQDRIECALATDPTLPKFIKDPQFVAEFQRVTGKSLQDVINLNASTILTSVAPGAIQNAYGALKGKTSFGQFLGSAAKLVGGVLGNLTSDEDRKTLVTGVVPKSFHGLLPGTYDPSQFASAPNDSIPGAGAQAVGASSTGTSLQVPGSGAGDKAALAARVAGGSNAKEAGTDSGDRPLMLTGSVPEVDRAPATAVENDPSISIFERVSKRYRLTQSRLTLLN